MNILVLTSIYPQPDDKAEYGVTPVVHSFAKEWAKKHNVIVIHNHTAYPKLYSKILNSRVGKLNSLFGINFPIDEQNNSLNLRIDGVNVYRLPMVKLVPRLSFSKTTITQRFHEITKILNENNFKPDLIVGHWENPQVPLVSKLKKYYEAKSAIVFHELVYSKNYIYRASNKKHIVNIDNIGARSIAISKQLESFYNYKKNIFLCQSGIPDDFFNEIKYPTINFKDKKTSSYVFVGRLVKRKNVNISIKVLAEIEDYKQFKFNIIGNGEEYENLKSLTRELNILNNVNFFGRLNRENVLEIMNESEIFIMVSNSETFGLVYIEAMSRGCIVIANEDGGMNGIIQSGINGFLSKSDDYNDVLRILNHIKSLSLEEKSNISNEARNTALSFKDSSMANKYLNELL